MNRARAGFVVVAAVSLVLGSVTPTASGVTEPGPVPPGCTGGIAANPSVEKVTQRGAPEGYLFTPAAPVPPRTPDVKKPRLFTDGTYPADGARFALVQTPDGMVSSAEQDQKFVPGGAYTLTDWTGTLKANLSYPDRALATGLRFYDGGGKQVLEHKLDVGRDVDQGGLERQDFAPVVAPDSATSVKFFAATNYTWVMWDCVYLQLAAYSVRLQVQNPATGEWAPIATIPAGGTARFKITVTNEGTQTLENVTARDPWCALPTDGFPLAAGESRDVLCEHANVTEQDNGHVGIATVAAAYPGGTLPEKSASASIVVTPPPAIGRIGDYVWADGNRNGVQDRGEAGVRGVRVLLKSAGGDTVATTTTGTDGKYLFDKLKPGTYQVCFDVKALPPTHSGYLPTRPHLGDPARDSDADPATGCTPPTTIDAAHRENLALDLGLIPGIRLAPTP
ncbi:SdrD B-like domain-containing protein [Amycolatopsis sp. NPDC059021]|uniref:DUF7850 domain-containing protein n=1 Tax=Amycolatopsis sp. NPDC059021 TaxID=3346704 RepID=UPI00366D44AD